MKQMARLLNEYYRKKSAGQSGYKVRNLKPMPTGWESDMFSFDLVQGSLLKRKRKPFVLRIYTGESTQDKAFTEFRSMRRLHEVGYPVPKVHHMETEDSPFGKPFVIMEWIEGRQLADGLLKGSQEHQARYNTKFCEIFVRLHQLDWRSFSSEQEQPEARGPYGFIDYWLNFGRSMSRSMNLPGFEAVVGWLAAHRDEMACQRPAPIHNDFHPFNVLVRPDESLVVLDWTGFRISDPRFDLAWTLTLARGYMGESWRQKILREYTRLADDPVNMIELFEVFACTRRLFDFTASLAMGAEQMGMRPETVNNMKNDLPVYTKIYQHLTNTTGIRIREVEKMIDQIQSS